MMGTYQNACECSLCWPISHCLKVTETISVFYCNADVGYFWLHQHWAPTLRAEAISWIFPGVGVHPWCSTWAITHWASTSKHPTTFIKTFHYFTALQCHNSARNISLWCQQTYYNFKQAIIHFNIVNVLQAYFFKNKVLRPPSHFSIMIITLYILILQPCHISLVLSLLWLTGTDWLKMLLALLMLLWCCWAGHQRQSAGRIFRQPGYGLA